MGMPMPMRKVEMKMLEIRDVVLVLGSYGGFGYLFAAAAASTTITSSVGITLLVLILYLGEKFRTLLASTGSSSTSVTVSDVGVAMSSLPASARSSMMNVRGLDADLADLVGRKRLLCWFRRARRMSCLCRLCRCRSCLRSVEEGDSCVRQRRRGRGREKRKRTTSEDTKYYPSTVTSAIVGWPNNHKRPSQPQRRRHRDTVRIDG